MYFTTFKGLAGDFFSSGFPHVSILYWPKNKASVSFRLYYLIWIDILYHGQSTMTQLTWSLIPHQLSPLELRDSTWAGSTRSEILRQLTRCVINISNIWAHYTFFSILYQLCIDSIEMVSHPELIQFTESLHR